MWLEVPPRRALSGSARLEQGVMFRGMVVPGDTAAIAVTCVLWAGGGYACGYASAAQAQEAQAPPPGPLAAPVHERPRVLLFGDSITQYSFDTQNCGWGAGLADWYSRHADVVNRGFSGFNSRQGLALLRRMLPLDGPVQPRVLTIKFGANDAAAATLNPQQHVPLAEYESNLRDMVAHATSSCPGVHVILITPPSVDEAGIRANSLAKGWLQHGDEIDRTVAGVRPYADVMRRVGCNLSLPVVDLWEGGDDAVGSTPQDFVDGLHLSPSGNRKLLAALQQVIRRECSRSDQASLLLPVTEADGNGMPMHFPHWSEATLEAIQTWVWPAQVCLRIPRG